MENLSPDEIKRFMIFSKAFEEVEDNNADLPLVNHYYEGRFKSFDSFYKDLPEKNYYRMAKRHISSDLFKINKGKQVDKSYLLDNLIDQRMNPEERASFIDTLETLEKQLTFTEQRVIDFLKEARESRDICARLSISKPRLSVLMEGIRKKLKIILKSPLTF